jgi:hypothetical protein
LTEKNLRRDVKNLSCEMDKLGDNTGTRGFKAPAITAQTELARRMNLSRGRACVSNVSLLPPGSVLRPPICRSKISLSSLLRGMVDSFWHNQCYEKQIFHVKGLNMIIWRGAGNDFSLRKGPYQDRRPSLRRRLTVSDCCALVRPRHTTWHFNQDHKSRYAQVFHAKISYRDNGYHLRERVDAAC